MGVRLYAISALAHGGSVAQGLRGTEEQTDPGGTSRSAWRAALHGCSNRSVAAATTVAGTDLPLAIRDGPSAFWRAHASLPVQRSTAPSWWHQWRLEQQWHSTQYPSDCRDPTARPQPCRWYGPTHVQRVGKPRGAGFSTRGTHAQGPTENAGPHAQSSWRRVSCLGGKRVGGNGPHTPQ